MNIRLFMRLFGCVLFFFLCIFLLPSGNVFAISAVPNTTLAPSGAISAILVSTTTTYVGGAFTSIGRNSNHFGVFSTSTASTSATFSSGVGLGSVGNGQVVISDRQGGWYVGGFFTTVGTYTRNHIVHILADGSVDTAFDPNIAGSGAVYALALSPDGNTLYVGGDFTTVNGGTTRNYLAAFNTSNGTVTSFNPDPDLVVYSFALNASGSTLYVGGNFQTFGGVTVRSAVAAITTSNSAVTGFDPNLGNGPVESVAYSLSLSPDETYLYVGGDFSTVGGTTRNFLAAVKTSDGSVTDFDPNLSAYVTSIALAPNGDTLYAGGTFNGANSVNGNTTRNHLAAFATSTGTVVAGFDPNLGNAVNTIALSPDGSTLYAGGSFAIVNGSVTRSRGAAFSTSNGTVTSFDPNISGTVFGMALAPDGSGLAAAGSFTRSNLVTRNRLAAFDNATGELTSFDPNMSGTVSALALSADGNTLYAGGTFSTVNGGTSRSRLAALSTTNGTATSFNPAIAGGNVSTLALTSDGSILYVGGTFTGSNSVNGNTTRNYLAAVTTSDGVVTAFDPNMSSNVNALTLSSDNSTLYVGGSFTTVGGGATTRNRLASFTVSNGAVTSFNPNISTGDVFTITLSSDETILYAGGSLIGAVNGGAITRNRLAAFSVANSTVTDFDPNFNNNVNAIRFSSDGGTLYVGGSFQTVGGAGTTRNRFAAFTAASGNSPTSFNPNFSNTVNSIGLSSDDSILAAGGSFAAVGGGAYTRLSYVSFAGPGTPTSLGATSYVNGSSSSSTAPMLSFSLGHASSTATVKYQIQVSTSSNFTTTTIDYTSELGTTGSKSFTVGQAVGSGSYATGAESQTLSDDSYYWRVKTIDQAADASGYKSANLGAVAFVIDTIAPAISSVVASPNSTDATITWTTDTAADSKVEYGDTSLYGSATTLADTSGVTSHSISVTGLSACTTYHYRVDSSDLAGNLTTSSDATFTTSGCSSGGGGGGGSSSSGRERSASPINNSPVPATHASSTVDAPSSSIVLDISMPLLLSTPALSLWQSAEGVRELQKFLNVNGFTVATAGPGSQGQETTTFGSATMAALVRFQEANGISPAIGYFGPKTKAFIQSSQPVSLVSKIPISSETALPSFSRDLSVGISGNDVIALQKLLINESSGPAAIKLSLTGATGYFGQITGEALKEFQAKNNISPVSGYFGLKTRTLVNSLNH